MLLLSSPSIHNKQQDLVRSSAKGQIPSYSTTKGPIYPFRPQQVAQESTGSCKQQQFTNDHSAIDHSKPKAKYSKVWTHTE